MKVNLNEILEKKLNSHVEDLNELITGYLKDGRNDYAKRDEEFRDLIANMAPADAYRCTPIPEELWLVNRKDYSLQQVPTERTPKTLWAVLNGRRYIAYRLSEHEVKSGMLIECSVRIEGDSKRDWYEDILGYPRQGTLAVADEETAIKIRDIIKKRDTQEKLHSAMGRGAIRRQIIDGVTAAKDAGFSKEEIVKEVQAAVESALKRAFKA